MPERDPVTGDGAAALEEICLDATEPSLGDADLGDADSEPGSEVQSPSAWSAQGADAEADGDTRFAETTLGPETPPTDAPEAQDAIPAQVVSALEARGKLTHAEYGRARRLAEDGGDTILPMLVRLGLVSEKDMALALAEVLDLPLAQLTDYPEAPVAEGRLTLRFLKDSHTLPLREDAEGLDVAVANPTEGFFLEALTLALGKPVRVWIGLPSEIDVAVDRLYEQSSAKPAEQDGEGGEFDEEDIEHLKDLASEAPVIRMVNQIMQRAVDARASDIHIEPFADELKVRYRVDGILKEVDSPPVRSTAAIISRVKIMAKLNIAERRLPQDGRIPLRVQGKELDLRVSTVPTMFGESVVMRLLDKESVRFDLDSLGFDGPPKARLLSVLDAPYGILLVTGPTGSGKSTTLYTALSRLNTQERKIITVEDPVEYQLPGINQIQVKAAIGMTFAGALRAIVRQDPDIIMVGEMRDLETARIAVQSALTGHVVLSTLHTNDAASGVTRLLEMGVEDYLLTSTVNGILAQRLVRRLCPHCRTAYQPLPEVAAKLAKVAGGAPITLHRAVGCDRCNATGYRGRLVITEVLLMTDAVRQAVLRHATATDIQRIAIDEGMITMYDDGLRKALDGRTTVEEVMRVAEEA
jgi:general secretion pathway protein E